MCSDQGHDRILTPEMLQSSSDRYVRRTYYCSFDVGSVSSKKLHPTWRHLRIMPGRIGTVLHVGCRVSDQSPEYVHRYFAFHVCILVCVKELRFTFSTYFRKDFRGKNFTIWDESSS